MAKCKECFGEGLLHQGESIHKVCSACKGTGLDDAVVVPEEEVVVEVEDEEVL